MRRFLQRANQALTASWASPSMLLLVLLLFPFCKPVGIDSVSFLRIVFLLWKVAAIVYLMIVLPQKYVSHYREIPKGFVGLAVFWLICICGCIRANADLVSTAIAAVSSLLLLLMIHDLVREKKGRLLLTSLSWLFTLLIIAHIASVLLHLIGTLFSVPITGATVYLFGMDNYSSFFMYPMLSIVLFCHCTSCGGFTKKSWILLFGLTAAYISTASYTAAGVGLVMIVLCLLRYKWNKLPERIDVRWGIALYAVLLVLICGFKVQNLLAGLLNAMQKGVTLNSRTLIWADTLELIAKRPLVGYGSFTPEQISQYILYGTTHAHNLLLEILLRAGILGAGGYLFFLCGFASVKGGRLSRTSHKTVLLIGFLAQLILGFMDFYTTILVFYIFMGILYTADELTVQCAPKKEASP